MTIVILTLVNCFSTTAFNFELEQRFGSLIKLKSLKPLNPSLNLKPFIKTIFVYTTNKTYKQYMAHRLIYVTNLVVNLNP